MSDADTMVMLARILNFHRDKVLEISGVDDIDTALGRVALAKAMERRGTAFMFRAMVEGWDFARINRELY